MTPMMRESAQQAFAALIDRLIEEAALYGRPARAEDLQLTEADLVTVLNTDPSLIETTLRRHLDTFAYKIDQTIRYGTDAATKRTEIGAAVRGLLWGRVREIIWQAVRAESARREEELRLEREDLREGPPLTDRTVAALEAGVSPYGEIA